MKSYLTLENCLFMNNSAVYGGSIYHKYGNTISDLLYSLRDLMYIVDEAGNRIPWTNRKQTIIQFAKLADEQGFLLEPPEEFRSSSDPQYGRVPEVVPVIHTTHKP